KVSMSLALDSTGRVWKFSNGTWTLAPYTGLTGISHIAVAPDGSQVMAAKGNSVYSLNMGTNARALICTEATPILGIAVNGSSTYTKHGFFWVDSAGVVRQKNYAGIIQLAPTGVTGTINRVSVNHDGFMWLTNTANALFQGKFGGTAFFPLTTVTGRNVKSI